MAAPSGEHVPPCSQSAADTAPLVRTRAPHGARANRGRTREASSAVRTKLSAWRPLGARRRSRAGAGASAGRARNNQRGQVPPQALGRRERAWDNSLDRFTNSRYHIHQAPLAPLFAAAILLGVLFFFAHRAGRRAVNDLDFKLEHPPSAAVQVVAPPPTADVELVAP